MTLYRKKKYYIAINDDAIILNGILRTGLTKDEFKRPLCGFPIGQLQEAARRIEGAGHESKLENNNPPEPKTKDDEK